MFFCYLKCSDWYFDDTLLSLVLTSSFHSSAVMPSQSSNFLVKRQKLLFLREVVLLPDCVLDVGCFALRCPELIYGPFSVQKTVPLCHSGMPFGVAVI